MRVVFLGTPQAAVPTLEALIRSGYDVPLVVTRPDRAVGRSGRAMPPPVKRVATEAGLTVLQPTRVRTPQFRETLASQAPDALIVVAYGRILPRSVLEVPRLAPVNVHFSLLPRYRGAAPVQWALARGESRTGVTTMLMSEGLDEGDVLLEREVVIEPGEHAPALEARLAVLGAELALETLAGLAAGRIAPRPQDPERATYAPILTKEQGHVSPELAAAEIEGRVRGFDPWPGVWLSHPKGRLRLVEVAAVPGETSTATPGSVTEGTDGGLLLVCGGGTALALERIQFEGRRAMSSREARNGRQLTPGDRLEPL